MIKKFLVSCLLSVFVEEPTSLKEIISSHLKKQNIFKPRFLLSDLSRLLVKKKNIFF